MVIADGEGALLVGKIIVFGVDTTFVSTNFFFFHQIQKLLEKHRIVQENYGIVQEYMRLLYYNETEVAR